ncbi:MAG: endolytic transglycosylase MltG [Ignavibacteriae bacterium]|nr:MAG: endolytic transglycosylase MltG [Ignavibacteriota bacterium]
MKKRLLHRWLWILFLLGVLLSAFAYYVFLFPYSYQEPKGKMVIIPRGASFRAAVDSLESAHAIRHRWSFQIAGRLLGYTKTIKTGKYLFISGQSNLDILKDIRIGKSRLILSVTIPEGWRMEQTARRFKRDLGIDADKFLALCTDKEFIRSHGIEANSLEGYLLPETYSFYWQTEEREILERMLEGFKHFYNDSLLERQREMNVSQREILTMASIVEAESSVSEERPVIAGVYWNRLKKRMRLEADPTVQYALGERKKMNHQDLDVDSPYNTYRHYGLPPGPINNPGKLSIRAALYPRQNDYLYFVATGLGGHHFANKFSDHQKNIQQYHRTRRQMQRDLKK